MMDDFPTHQSGLIDIGDIRQFMHELVDLGMTVTKKPDANVFYVEVNDQFSVRITASDEPRSTNVQVQLLGWGAMIAFSNVNSIKGLRTTTAAYIRESTGRELSAKQPQSTRLHASTPADNMAKISGLIGGRTVEAYFDPYLDNKGL
jgi:hypothetical protein